MTEEEKNGLVNAFLCYGWIVSYTNPIVERLYIGNLSVPPYIKEQVVELAETEATNETLENPNRKPNYFLSSASINILLSGLIYEDIPLYKVGDREISCMADIGRLWKETGLSADILGWKEHYQIRAFLATQHRKILKELETTKIDTQDTPQDTPSKIIPFPTPSGTQWREVEISFIDSENVKISARDKTATKHFFDMGFRKGKTCKPVKSWHTLFAFSEKRCLKYSQSIKSKTEKDIQDLRKRLKAYFGIQDDPITLNQGYEPVFKVFGSESEGRSVRAFSNNAIFDEKKND